MPASPRLRIESGDGRGRDVPLTRAFVVGRAQSCDLVLNDESCSRMHARITPEGARARVEDLGSTNGTFKNGERITEEPLDDGDAIVVGGTTLRFHAPRFDGGATVILSPAARKDAAVVAEIAADGAEPEVREGHARALLDSTLGLLEATRGMLDRPQIARALCEQLCGLISADRSAALLFRQHSGDPRDARLVSVPELRLEPDRPWIAQAIESRQALLLKDDAGKRSLFGLVIPVFHGAEPQLLVYADRRARAFDENDLADALQLVRTASALHEVAVAHQSLREEVVEHRTRYRSDRRLVGESSSHQQVVEAVRRNAAGGQSVLFIGETGTGKELFARLLHDLSARANRRFVSVNCSATPDGLLEDELFGSEPEPGDVDAVETVGALERANGGTLFLDEIDAMDLPTQARLAQVLKERQLRRTRDGRVLAIDVRLVAASDRNLSGRARTGAFHEDLLALLALGTVPIEPLRERKEDIPLLADHFLKLHARRMNRTARRLDGDALRAMTAYAWPGNVRELSNVIERAVMLSSDEEIAADLLPFREQAPLDADELKMTAVEKRAIERALEFCRYKKGETAKTLGISWPTLNKKIADYGIALPEK